MDLTTTRRVYLHLLDGIYIRERNTFLRSLALSLNVFAIRSGKMSANNDVYQTPPNSRYSSK